ncbi:MAG: FUSC family protein [Oscillospiraceae bacterium]|jgi:uncharacterized membrane protein YgaE (UPF0421/DUF939 family)|nr:FUSC family protein [Oscillospiraceae bacterium]
MKERFPKIGKRTVKTALAATACLLLFTGLEQLGALLEQSDYGFLADLGGFLTKQQPIFGCVAAVICMQQTVKNSLHSGINRIIGTVLGGCVGLFFFWVNRNVWDGRLRILWVAVGSILAIWLVLLLKKPNACAICAITFLIILVAAEKDTPYLYAVNRMLDTAIGIAVSVAVNHWLWRPKHMEEDHTDE